MSLQKFILTIFLAATLLAANGAAQTKAKKTLKNRLPRVGVIKDMEYAGKFIGDGCNQHFMRLPNKPEGDEYVFVSGADASVAWMNLNGSDVKLELVKSTLWYRRGYDAFALHIYRAGKTRITISFWQYNDYTTEYPAKIVLRKGRARRTIRLIGLPQCDAL